MPLVCGEDSRSVETGGVGMGVSLARSINLRRVFRKKLSQMIQNAARTDMPVDGPKQVILRHLRSRLNSWNGADYASFFGSVFAIHFRTR